MINNKLGFTMLILAGLLVFASGCPQSEKEPTTKVSTPTATPAAPATGWTGNARDFTYSKYDGSSAKIGDLAGKPVVLNFWGTW